MDWNEERRRRRQMVAPLFAYLDDRGVRRTWLAERLGISKQRLYLIELGERPIPEGFLERGYRELGVPAALAERFEVRPRRPARKAS